MSCKQNIDKRATGHKLYRLIEKSDMTYEQIAEFLGLRSSRVIYAWTNGEKLPSTVHLYNLASLFRVHMEDILA